MGWNRHVDGRRVHVRGNGANRASIAAAAQMHDVIVSEVPKPDLGLELHADSNRRCGLSAARRGRKLSDLWPVRGAAPGRCQQYRERSRERDRGAVVTVEMYGTSHAEFIVALGAGREQQTHN